MNKTHPKLVARGPEMEEDAGLKFKGAPADDCDPFAIQNYIDRLAADVYDATNPNKSDRIPADKDEWEYMKEKAKNVPFQEVSLSIALKHGLLDEVKKENSNKSFEKESILTIMKVRDEFLRDYADATAFEYQWQIWVEWERYLKQIGVTIPQWGKIARKLIRLGVTRIQDDMTKKYSSSSSSSNNKRKTDGEEAPVAQERRRRVTHPIEPYNGSTTASPYSNFSTPVMQRSSSFGGYMDPANPFSSSNTPSTPEPYSPMQSPVATSPPFPPPFSSPTFGASLYNMIQTASSTAPSIFSTSTPMRSPSMTTLHMDSTSGTAYTTTNQFPLSNGTSIPFPYDPSAFMTSTVSLSSSLPTMSSSIPYNPLMLSQPTSLAYSQGISPSTFVTPMSPSNMSMYPSTIPIMTSSSATPSPMMTTSPVGFSSPIPSPSDPSPSIYMSSLSSSDDPSNLF